MKHYILELKVDEANDANLVQGTEGKITTLTCSLEGGSSNDMLHWITDNKTLTSGKPPSLKYTFMPDQSDDTKEFTCRGIIMTIRYFLTKKVTLNLYREYVYKTYLIKTQNLNILLQWYSGIVDPANFFVEISNIIFFKRYLLFKFIQALLFFLKQKLKVRNKNNKLFLKVTPHSTVRVDLNYIVIMYF